MTYTRKTNFSGNKVYYFIKLINKIIIDDSTTQICLDIVNTKKDGRSI